MLTKECVQAECLEQEEKNKLKDYAKTGGARRGTFLKRMS